MTFPQHPLGRITKEWLESLLSDKPADKPADVPNAYPPNLVEAEAIAEQFHDVYEDLAPIHNYSTRPRSRKPWRQVPANNRALMIATVQKLLDEGAIMMGAKTARKLNEQAKSRKGLQFGPKVD